MSNSITALVNFPFSSPFCTADKLNDTFSQDNIHVENEKCEFRFYGCLINHSQLLESHGCANLSELIPLLYEKHKQNIVLILKGSYTLLFFDKVARAIYLSNDLLSKKAIYYHHNDSFFAASNNFSDLLRLLSGKRVACEIDTLACSMMLSQGFLWDDVTWARQVKYLRPFEYITIDENGFSLCNLQNSLEYGFGDNTISYHDAIEKFDKLFKAAVTLQYQKTQAGGYLPLASLSAGMDSRAVVLCAQSLGYKNTTCFTYAQSGSVDDSIAKKIAYDYGLDHIFYQLDSANFILDVNRAFKLNQGEQTYCGATGALGISEILDHQKYGIIHTGVLGGELMGDIQRSLSKVPAVDEISATSAAKAFDLPEIEKRYALIMQKYSCQQQLDIQKHLRACQNFSHMASQHFESISPFLDEDVYLFLASLPFEYKKERKLYVQWMNTYIPNDYVTTYMYGKPKSSEILRKARYAVRILKSKLLGKSKYDMNPFDYWAKTQPHLVSGLQKQLATCLLNIKTEPNSVSAFLQEQAQSENLDTLIKAVTTAKAAELMGQFEK